MKKNKPLKKLWELLVLEKKEIVSIYFYAILSGLLQLSVPIGVQAIIGFVMGANMVTSIYVLIVVIVLGVLMVGIMQINQMKIIEKIQQNIFTRYAFKFSETIPRLDLKKIDQYYLPEKVNLFFDTITLQKGLSKILLDTPTASIQILFGLLLLSFYHPAFIAFGVLLVFILWLILKLTSAKGLSTSLQESGYKYNVVAWIEEMARVIRSFKFSQGTHLNLSKTDENVVGYLKARTAHFKVLVFQYQALVAFKVCITLAMLVVGTYLLLNQQLNIGEFIAAEIVILTIISSVEKLIGSLDSVYDVITGLEKLAYVTEADLEHEGNYQLISNNIGLNIEMINFEFGYNDDFKVLNGININIPSNSLICIKGDEGVGKSTLLQVLNGSYTDYKGKILINKVPLRNYTLQSLRENIGVFMYHQDLFNGTLWENISMGKQEITPDRISNLASMLGVSDYIYGLPFGFESHINTSGEKLPSSITKKILLLRAFANNPRLLLLDEPFANFEPETQEKIKNYIQQLKLNTTILVISNDEKFASKCDYQLTLKMGKSTFINNK